MQKSFRELIALPRSRLAGELITRLSQEQMAAKRDLLPRWSQGQLAAEVILAEVKCRQQFTFAELANLA